MNTAEHCLWPGTALDTGLTNTNSLLTEGVQNLLSEKDKYNDEGVVIVNCTAESVWRSFTYEASRSTGRKHNKDRAEAHGEHKGWVQGPWAMERRAEDTPLWAASDAVVD